MFNKMTHFAMIPDFAHIWQNLGVHLTLDCHLIIFKCNKSTLFEAAPTKDLLRILAPLQVSLLRAIEMVSDAF
jgi:hypothetical protein